MNKASDDAEVRVSSEEGIEEFRSVLNQAPSKAVFDEVCALIPRTGELSQVQRDYIVGHLSKWPAAIERAVPSKGQAMKRRGFLGWQDSPAYGLCNLLAPTSCDDLMKLPVDRLASMDRLDLSALSMDVGDVEVLASWEKLSSVRWLRLSINSFGDEGVRALLGSPHITQLETLELMGCDVSAQGVEAIMASPGLDALRVLDLRHNAIGPKGAKALAGSPRAAQLEWVYVGLEDVKKSGVQALVKSEVFATPLRAYFQALRDSVS